MRSAKAEQVIAIDGLAIVVHPGNPVDSLTTAQLARLFAGEIRNWRELGGQDLPVRLHARDDRSGTYDTFNELVLARQGKSLWSDARRYESNDELSARSPWMQAPSASPAWPRWARPRRWPSPMATRNRCCPPAPWSRPKTTRCRAGCSSMPIRANSRPDRGLHRVHP